MNDSKFHFRVPLFLLYFILQWAGQWAAAVLSGAGEKKVFTLVILYGCFLSRGIIWMIILRFMKLSRAYTLSSLSYLIVPLLSHFILHETLHLRYLPAGLLILAGIGLFGLGEQSKKDSHEE